MNISDGLIIRNTVESINRYIINKGKPVVVSNQATIEVLNFGFELRYNKLLDLEDIRKNMIEYYFDNAIDFNKLEELENSEYLEIENELYDKFKLFEKDRNSRQVLFTDDCCISMIHFLIRNGTIHCYMHLRSSDCVNKLFSDLNLVHKIIKKLQEIQKIDSVEFKFKANSIHKIIYNI